MTDRELLTLAAKVAGMQEWCAGTDDLTKWAWNPLTDDGDALRLAVRLNLDISFDTCDKGISVTSYGNWDKYPGEQCVETFEDLGFEAARRAIVRAAAEIGKDTK